MIRDNTKLWSELQQRAYKTLDRNIEIRESVQSGQKRQVDCAKEHGISRQCINKIVNSPRIKKELTLPPRPKNPIIRGFYAFCDILYELMEFDRRGK